MQIGEIYGPAQGNKIFIDSTFLKCRFKTVLKQIVNRIYKKEQNNVFKLCT